MNIERKAIYCINCVMWFDTKRGWQAGRSSVGTPFCPCCGAPLLELPYKDFIKHNVTQGRLEEVMSWRYPDGNYWEENNHA